MHFPLDDGLEALVNDPLSPSSKNTFPEHWGFLQQHTNSSSLPPGVYHHCESLASVGQWRPLLGEGVVLQCMNEISGSSPLPSTFSSLSEEKKKSDSYLSRIALRE